VLKIDLLPKHFAIARTNKRLLAGAVVFLVVVLAAFFLKYNAIQADMVRTEEAIAEVQPIADQVRELEGEISEKQGWLDPIKGKIDFIAKADESGGKFFDCFHSINEYIWQGAQMSSFSISGSSVSFTVEVRGTTGVGRFLLNLLRCPDLTNITYSGLPGGQSIEASGSGGAATMGAGAPGIGMPGPGDRGGFQPPMLGGGGPIGAPGMPGPAAGPTAQVAAASGVEPGSPNEPITLQISATLTEPITIPSPPSQAVAGAGMGGGMMGPGMMGPDMMGPDMMGPGMAPPGAMGPVDAGGPPGAGS